MSRKLSPPLEKHKLLFSRLSLLILLVLVIVGIFAKKKWLPSIDPPLGDASRLNTRSTTAVPSTTPQLSKEYIYAGTQLLAVEDANANPILPADLAVWRSTSGVWWVMGGAAGSQPATQSWGTNGDKPVQGDYDGDGKTDFSIYRPSSGEWYVLQSSDNTWGAVFAWGVPSDVRVPADYDGDGKTDRAVWRSTDGVWYIVRSSDGASIYQTYGVNGDAPAPADYDGDGRADLAIWRSASQTFYSIGTATGRTEQITIPQASSGKPVSADYDGDGKADRAVRDGANWIIRQSSDGQTIVISWQSATDIAVPNDYDGDGKCDIAVWRNSNGNWYIRQSAFGNSLRQVQWGIPGDTPVPAVYRR